ncbi:MAG TPA: toll/interleukin-1 receptor domain-containing protein [Candidatus Eisenbacteria bacterium]|nr:toll/interleukin-1 receptor domain-containing protein [Candidatus Eisenbacteria bacterium]
MPTVLPSICLSYSREDSEFALRLIADLRGAGIKISPSPIEPVSDGRLNAAVEHARSHCTRLLVVLSPASVHSDIDDEVSFALVTKKEKTEVIGVLLKDCKLPKLLSDVEQVDFRRDYVSGLKALRQRLATEKLEERGGSAAAASERPLHAPSSAKSLPAVPGRKAAVRDQSNRQESLNNTLGSPEKNTSSGSNYWKLLRFLGRVLLTIAALGFVGSAVTAKSALDSATAWEIIGIGLTVAFVIALAGAKCLKRGKQLGAESAAELMTHDSRAPVVYLRSFQDDWFASQGSMSKSSLAGGLIPNILMGFLDLAGGVMTEEEQLAEALKDVGPFVAVGKPGEKLPVLGASRMYLQDSEWQERVHDLMLRARLLVLRAGKTEGLWWEVQTAARIVKPEKIVFLLPYNEKAYNLFRAKAEQYLGCDLPDYSAGSSAITLGGPQGILYFEPNWRPHFLELKGFDRTFQPWVRAFKTTLQPVYKQLGVDVQLPKPSVLKILAFILLLPVVAILVFLLIGVVIKSFTN